MKAWNIKQLEEQHKKDLSMCRSEFERINCRAFHGADIRKAADYWSQHRKLTPFEVAIAENYGWRK